MFAFLMILGYVLLIGVIIAMFISNPRKGFMALGISVVIGMGFTLLFGPIGTVGSVIIFFIAYAKIR